MTQPNKITRSKVAKGIDKITLNEIKLTYDLEKILLDTYEGAEHDFACYLVKKHYDRRMNSFDEPVTDRRLQDRVLTEAKWFAMNLLATDLPALIDRTQLYMLIEADQTGWYRKMEYKDIEELILSMIDDVNQSGSEAYDWRFIVEKLVPAARSFGITPEVLGNATHQIKKLRDSIPAARLLLKRHENGDLTDAAARKDLKWIVENVANPKIQSSQLKPELDRYRGIIPDSEVNVQGHIYMTGEQSAILMIPVSNQLELRVIQQRLQKRVSLSVADYKAFAEEAIRLLDIKEDELWERTENKSKDG